MIYKSDVFLPPNFFCNSSSRSFAVPNSNVTVVMSSDSSRLSPNKLYSNSKLVSEACEDMLHATRPNMYACPDVATHSYNTGVRFTFHKIGAETFTTVFCPSSSGSNSSTLTEQAALSCHKSMVSSSVVVILNAFAIILSTLFLTCSTVGMLLPSSIAKTNKSALFATNVLRTKSKNRKVVKSHFNQSCGIFR